MQESSVLSSEQDEEEDDDDESDEELRRMNFEVAKEKQRQREIRRRKKLKEWKRKGVSNIVDAEAVESDDEWQGLGGADGELSDVTDSEDEKMLDDTSKLVLNESELRQKFAQEQYQNDDKMIRRLLDDLKNGNLRKRRAGGLGNNGLDLELSDEEEEELRNYYKSRLEKQKRNLMQDSKMAEIANDDKSRAFFESIADKPVEFKLEDDLDDLEGPVEEEQTPSGGKEDELIEDQEDNPFLADENPSRKKRKIKVTSDYISKTLSMILEDKATNYEDAIEKNQTLSKLQHGSADEEDDIADLYTLKKQSSITISSSGSISSTSSKKPLSVPSLKQKQQVEETEEDEIITV
ncbi:hypothetical protein PACTADRAFT_47810, partial [Pachysolen tannophilus NRRL Y-2460]